MRRLGNFLLSILLFGILIVAIYLRISPAHSYAELKNNAINLKEQTLSMHWAEEGIMKTCLLIADGAGKFTEKFGKEAVDVVWNLWPGNQEGTAPASTVSSQEQAASSQEPSAAEQAYASWPDILYEKVPILMYHVVDDASDANSLYLSPSDFQEQLDYFESEGIHPITMDQLYRHWTSREKLPPKPVVLTFDDGYRSMYTEAFPRLKAKGWPGVFYVYTDAIGSDSYMTPEMIREMAENGMEIGSHTVHHLDMATLSADQVKDELEKSKVSLGQITGIGAVSFCYPSGSYTKAVMQAVEEAGYRTAVTTENGTAHWKDNFYALSRIRINRGDDASAIKAKLQSMEDEWK